MKDKRGYHRFQSEAMGALDSVYRFALKLTGDEADAEDLVQETYLIAFQRRELYQLGTNCKAWLFTICRHYWLQQLRRANRITACDDLELEVLAAGLGRDNEGDAAQKAQDCPEFSAAVDRALGKLPEAYRTPVVIVDIEDQSYQVAADILGVPVGTVRSRLFRGRRMLQEQLMVFAQHAGIGAKDGSCEGTNAAQPLESRLG